MSEQSHIYVEEHGDVAVVRFEDRKIIDELVIQELGSELMALVDEQNRMKIVLNFENVEFLSSAALGKLILLDKRAKEAGGLVKLCEIRNEIYTAFKITKLNESFDIQATEHDAVDSFAE